MNLKKIINPWIGTPSYNCFVCCPTNPKGLHLEFFEDGDYVVTKFKPCMLPHQPQGPAPGVF